MFINSYLKEPIDVSGLNQYIFTPVSQLLAIYSITSSFISFAPSKPDILSFKNNINFTNKNK